MKAYGIDVVIVTRNRYPQIIKCVQKICLNTRKPKRIIIIDSSISSIRDLYKDIVSQICKSSGIKILTVIIPHKGIAYARNYGLEQIKSKYFVFLDDDEYAPKNWLKNISDLININQDVDILHGPLIPGDLKNYWNRVWGLLLRENSQLEGKVQFLNVGNSVYRTKFVKENKLKFDERFTHASEDKAMFNELEKVGAKMYFSNRIWVKHDYRKTFTSFIMQWFHYGESMHKYNMWYKHNGDITNLGKIPITISGLLEIFPFQPGYNISILPGILILNLSFLTGFIVSFLRLDKLFTDTNFVV